MNTTFNNIFDDEIFNLNDNLDVELADKFFNNSAEEIIKSILNRQLKSRNIESYDRYFNWRRDNEKVTGLSIITTDVIAHVYLNDIQAIYESKNAMILVYKPEFNEFLYNLYNNNFHRQFSGYLMGIEIINFKRVNHQLGSYFFSTKLECLSSEELPVNIIEHLKKRNHTNDTKIETKRYDKIFEEDFTEYVL